MERRKAGDFPPEVLQLFDGFVHGRLSRRDFLDRAARYAGAGSRPRRCWKRSHRISPGRSR